MKLGSGFAKIQLCDNAELEMYSYTLTGLIQSDLIQMQQLIERDGERHIMANGEIRETIAGKRIKIVIPIRIIENITPSDWEDFIYYLYDWNTQGKIKVTPYIDEPSYAYWVILENGRRAERSVRQFLESDVLEFTSIERFETIS